MSDGIDHGTPRGYQQHRRRGHTAGDMRQCGCLAAHSDYTKYRAEIARRARGVKRNADITPEERIARIPKRGPGGKKKEPDKFLRWVNGKHGIKKGIWVDKYGTPCDPPEGK